jgi:hypothetical protein
MNVRKNTERCIICGGKLSDLATAEGHSCTVCGEETFVHINCAEGHLLCDGCHGREVRKAIERHVVSSRSQDPIALAEELLALPGLPMLSCDHAFIAAGALLAALRNSPYGSMMGEAEFREVFERTERQAHSGSCGLTGVCGIAPAAGAVVSIFLGSRCGADREQRLVMDLVNRVTGVLTGLTGPSCCKAYVRGTVAETAVFFSERFAVVLPVQQAAVVCADSSRHPHGCREDRCPYYRKPSQDIFASRGFIPGIVSCVT